MSLKCAACGSAFRTSDIHVELAIAKCETCHAVMDLAGRGHVEVGASALDFAAERQRKRVPMPERFEAVESRGLFTIRWRWFKPALFGLLFFCIAWDSFLVFWYATAIFAKDTPWLMIVFPICHVAVGVGLTYSTVAGFVNTTTIEVGRGTLRVTHGPIPWKGNRELDASEIRQLYCEEQTGQTQKDGTSRTYALSAVLQDGRKLKLLSSLDELGQALYVEQQLERCLRIKDAPVPGEVAVA